MATSSGLFVVCTVPWVMLCRTEDNWAPRPIDAMDPDVRVPIVLSVVPRTSVNDTLDALYPTVFRFATLLPTTFKPWLFVVSPDKAVEKVVKPILFLFSLVSLERIC